MDLIVCKRLSETETSTGGHGVGFREKWKKKSQVDQCTMVLSISSDLLT